MDKVPKLNVIEGDFGLVSMDIVCIQSILYSRLNKAPVEVKYLNNIKSCVLYNVPSLVCGNVVIDKFQKIVTHWKKLHGDIAQLSAKQSSESLALSNFVSMKLRPVLDFLFWVDQRNCDDFMNPWFMKALPFPCNYFYAKRKKNEAFQLIETLFPLDTDMEVIKEYIIKAATQSLSTLSTRLGKANFFYGDNPAILDVIVYSYLAPLVKLPLPSNDICSLLSMWPSLTDFVKRIDQKFFPEVRREVKYLETERLNQQSDDDVSYAALFILIVSATSLVLGFAVKRGILEFPNFQ